MIAEVQQEGRFYRLSTGEPLTTRTLGHTTHRYKTPESHPGLLFYTVKVDSIDGESDLSHSSEFVFDINENHPSSLTIRQISHYVIPPDNPFVMPPSPRCQRSSAHQYGADRQYRALELWPVISKYSHHHRFPLCLFLI